MGMRGLYSCFDHRFDFRILNFWDTTRTGRILSQPGTAEGQKTLPPELNRRTGNPQTASYVVAEDSIGCHLNDLGALYQSQGEAFPVSPESDSCLFLGI